MEALFPRKIYWQNDRQELVIAWHDSHESTFPLPRLRKICPCALCKSERENENPLKLFKDGSFKNFMILKIEPIGRYALKMTWADGHSSGIYSYDMLRQLCSCLHCKKS